MSFSIDHYEILQISKNATTEEIRYSYKNLAKQHHPDKGGNKEKFQEIQTAYEILSDENKKREYDNQQNGNQNFPSFPNIFHFVNNSIPIKKPDEIFKCPITLREVLFGTSRKFHITRKIRCEKCNFECNQCNGTGSDKNNQRIQIGPFLHIQNQVCYLCKGDGYKRVSFCEDCKNSGTRIKEFFIEILIQKGVENGKTYYYEGMGEAANKKNEINGNFIVVIEIKGTGNSTIIDFTSTPSMPEEEILSLLLFGKKLGEVSVLQSVQLAEIAKSDESGHGFFEKIRDSGGSCCFCAHFGAGSLDGLASSRTGLYAVCQREICNISELPACVYSCRHGYDWVLVDSVFEYAGLYQIQPQPERSGRRAGDGAASGHDGVYRHGSCDYFSRNRDFSALEIERTLESGYARRSIL